MKPWWLLSTQITVRGENNGHASLVLDPSEEPSEQSRGINIGILEDHLQYTW